MYLRRVTLLLLISLFVAPCAAPQKTAASAAASASTSVPPLIPYSGTAVATGGDRLPREIGINFQIFKDEAGGEALWAESQTVALDAAGHYTVQLGGNNPNGLPSELFSTGEARWLEVQVEGQEPQPRVLLASVPYALKAADAATLGGLPASAFALAGTGGGVAGGTASAAIRPETAANVTTTGGDAGYVPEFSGASTIVDSPIFVKGSSVGVGTIDPGAILDVNGALIVRGDSTLYGQLLLPAPGTATASTSYNSQLLKLYTSAWNSSSKAAVSPRFQWQAEVTGNNTASPGATLNLLTSTTTTPPTETGFHFNPNGTVNFAPGQSFPGTGPGTITGITAGTGLTGGGASGDVTLKLNTGTTDARYAQLNAGNTFAGTNFFNGSTYFDSEIYLSTSSTALAAYTQTNGSILGQLNVSGKQYGWAVEGNAYNANAGVYGYGDDNSEAGVIGSGNIGVYAMSDLHAVGGRNQGATTLTAGVYAQAGTLSGEAAGLVGVPAAVFADGGATKNGVYSEIGVIGVTDENSAAGFYNNGTSTTLYAVNAGGGSPFSASGTNGGCFIDGDGDLSCQGTITGSNLTADRRSIATYGVQAAENWYEDAGSGSLENGATRIHLDPAFVATVNTGVDYHVFLTPKGDCKGLYVANENADGFEVHELGGGRSGIAFDYRIMAKRKGYEQVRLEDVTGRVQKGTQAMLKSRPGASPASHPSSPPVPQRGQLRSVAGLDGRIN